MNETLQIIAISVGGIAVLLAFINIIVKPAWKSWLHRSPCEVHFTVPPLQQVRLDYVLQDDQGHHLNEIVLPAHKEVEIEIEYVPKLAFDEREISFGCDDPENDKPYATEIIRRVVAVGKSRWIPGKDQDCWQDRHGYIHLMSNKKRQKNSRVPLGFKIRTRGSGIYRANLFFFTEEKPGKATLTIRVEDKPHTPMRCVAHWGCRVTPMVSQN